MSRRSTAFFKMLTACAALVLLSACSLSPYSHVTKVNLKLTASDQLNPDLNGRPSPIVVRLFELKHPVTFENADFFSLYERAKESLAPDLVASEELELRPGETVELKLSVEEGSRYVGILAAYLFGLKAKGRWDAGRGRNMLDGGAHFYGSFECADGKFISVAAIETQFYAALMELTGLKNDPEFANQLDQSQWPKLREKVKAFIKTKSRDHWCKLLEGTDACVAPILDLDEAPAHPHNKARDTYADLAGVVQPTPAPRFSRTKPGLDLPPPFVGEHTDAVLQEWGFSAAEIESLRTRGTI